MRDRSTPNGRTSGAALKVPGVAPWPPGFEIALAGTIINVNRFTPGAGRTGVLEDWDFRGYALVVKTDVEAIRQCLFGETSPVGLNAYLFIETTGAVLALEDCDLTGPFGHGGAGAAIKFRPQGSGPSVVAGRLPILRRLRFTGLAADGIKAFGDTFPAGQIIEWCYFGPVVHVPVGTARWSATRTYTADEWITVGTGIIARSLQDGNLNHPPTTGRTTSNAWWKNSNPHADAITTNMVREALTVRRCLFDWVRDPEGPNGPYMNFGVNNWMRICRNAGSDFPLGRIDVEENVAYHGPYPNFPIEVASGGQPNFDGPVSFVGNWIGANLGGQYFHGNTNGLVDAWANNRDSTTDAVVSGPTLRPGTPTTLAVTSTSPADGSTDVATTGDITVSFNGPPVLGGAGTALELHREDAPGSLTLVQAWDLGLPAHLGTGAGQASVAGNTLTVRASGPRVAGKPHALRATHGAILSGAGVAFGETIGVTLMTFTTASAAPTGPRSHMSFGFLGQSNVEWTLETRPTFNPAGVPRPTITNPNCIFVGASSGAPDVMFERTVTDAAVRARQINLGVAVIAHWLGWLRPDMTFVLKDLAQSGTGRAEYMSDREDGNDPQFRRIAAHTERIALHKVAEWGELDLVVEFWSANDSRTFPTFDAEWCPLYTGESLDGRPVALGAPNPQSGFYPSTSVDHILWDHRAAPGQRGRGLFSDKTKWSPMFHADAGDRRDGYAAFYADPRSQRHAALRLGDWSYHLNAGHAPVDDPDGVVLAAWHYAAPIADAIFRAEGQPGIAQPQDYRIVVGPGGAYADVFVKLPNGGDLSTMRKTLGKAAPASPLTWQQEVTGIDVRRVGDTLAQRQPVFKPGTSGVPAKYRGTVTLRDKGTGTGAAREGCVRVTPEVPFVDGDLVYLNWWTDDLSPAKPYIGGHGLNSAPQKPFLDLLVETVPRITNPAHLYPYPGLPILGNLPPLVVSGVTAGGGDTTAPTLSSPTDAANGATAMTATVSTDEGSGTLYFRRRTGGTVSTEAQMLAAASQPVTVAGVQAVASGGLMAGTAYVTDFMQVDAAGNRSNIVSAGGFTTGASGGDPPEYWTHAADLRWKDPSSVPMGTRRIRIKAKFRVPAGVAPWAGDRFIAAHEVDGFNLALLRAATGSVAVRLASVKDGDRSSLGSVASPALGTSALADDTWHVIDAYADLADANVRMVLNGRAPMDVALTDAISPTTFETGREMTLGAKVGGAGAVLGAVPAGVQFQFIELEFYDASLALIRSKRVGGSAAEVNEDAWKAGTGVAA